MIGLPLSGVKKTPKRFWLMVSTSSLVMLSEWIKDLHNLLYMNLLLSANKLNRHKQIQYMVLRIGFIKIYNY